MPAYVIVEIEIVDAAGFEEYKKRVVPLIENYGGEYIVAGGQIEILEGNWKPNRIVVIEFPSMEQAKEWLNCEEYREISEIRQRTAKTNMILVEGI